MKTFDFLRACTVCMVVLMLLGHEAKAAAADSSTDGATVVRLHGKARFSMDNQTWQPVKKGTVLQAGYVIQTAANSSLDIRLSGKGRDTRSGEPAEGILRMEADTLLGLDQLSGTSAGNIPPQDVELDLRAGQIAGNAGPLPSASRYEIKFAKGIVGVRNGIFEISPPYLVVPSGEAVVVVIGSDGKATSTVVNTGNQFDAATGKASPIVGGIIPSLSPTPQSNAEPPAQLSPTPKGPGMGGSLRKF